MTRAADSSTTIPLLALFALECSALLIAMSIYKKGERPLLVFLTSPAGVVLLVAVLILAASTLGVFPLVREDLRQGTRRFVAVLALNFSSVALTLVTAEVMIRLFTVTTPTGREFAGTPLLPRSWEEIAARNRAMLARAAAEGSYLVYDSYLGWTIGPNRRSQDYNRDYVRELLSRRPGGHFQTPLAESQRVQAEAEAGIYLSSAEGLRSPRVGMSFADVPARRRIALVGDSFTFGLEVRYEETWGHQLELILGDGTQVLNFGVDGYGVDQAFLRYQRDVVSWHPDVVILGVINDDLRRTMCVYGFLCFPGAAIPFPKPRFVLNGPTLQALNLPLPTPDSIFEKASMMELPFIELDPGFRQRSDWEQHFYHRSHSIRLLISRFSRWPVPTPTTTDEAMRSLNGEILRSFLRVVREQGSIAIVVFFPSGTNDFMPESTAFPGVAKAVLEAARIPFLDLTHCVGQVKSDERFVALHYSALANAAVARCLADSIREGSSERAPA